MKKHRPNDDFTQSLVENLNWNVARDNSVFHRLIQGAILFAIQTHENDQKQKRKGKDIPYITHPLTVGIILASAGAPIHIIAAGILHDTIEDSIEEKKVTYEILKERFGSSVADIVNDVTEKNKDLPWSVRKQEDLEHLKSMEGPSLWVKSADVISNLSEIIADYKKSGDQMFSRFNASKKDIITNYKNVVATLIERWTVPPRKDENPMVLDLKTLQFDLENIFGQQN